MPRRSSLSFLKSVFDPGVDNLFPLDFGYDRLVHSRRKVGDGRGSHPKILVGLVDDKIAGSARILRRVGYFLTLNGQLLDLGTAVAALPRAVNTRQLNACLVIDERLEVTPGKGTKVGSGNPERTESVPERHDLKQTQLRDRSGMKVVADAAAVRHAEVRPRTLPGRVRNEVAHVA